MTELYLLVLYLATSSILIMTSKLLVVGWLFGTISKQHPTLKSLYIIYHLITAAAVIILYLSFSN